MNRIGDSTIRETSLEQTSEAAEQQQPQENTSAGVEPFVQASPEYKSALIAEQRLGGQVQEMLLRNQVIDLDEPEVPEAGKSPLEVVGETLQQVPEELNKQLGQIKDAWSDPAKAVGDMAKEAERIWSDIKDGN